MKVKKMTEITKLLIPPFVEFSIIIWVCIRSSKILNLLAVQKLRRIECARPFMKQYWADPKPMPELFFLPKKIRVYESIKKWWLGSFGIAMESFWLILKKQILPLKTYIIQRYLISCEKVLRKNSKKINERLAVVTW